MTLAFIFGVLAVACFVGAALGANSIGGRAINLEPLGFAFTVLAVIL